MQRGFILPIYFSSSRSVTVEIMPSRGRIMNFFMALRQHPGHSLSRDYYFVITQLHVFYHIIYLRGIVSQYSQGKKVKYTRLKS